MTRRRRHGCTYEPWFKTYESMVRRASGKHHSPCYANVDMDPSWRSDPAAFGRWAIANGYSPGLTIDRIDPGRGYWPDNCRWLPLAENVRRSHVSSPRAHGEDGRFISR